MLPLTDLTNLNACNRMGQAPIRIAVTNRNIDSVRLLLAAGADPDSPSPHAHLKYPLGIALWDYDDVLASILLQVGARPEGVYNALVQLYEVFEADTRDPDVRKSGRLNAGDDMPLQCYIKNAETLRMGVVRALLEHGADATIEDGQGRPLLSLLDRRGHVPGLRDMLVQNGAHSDEMRLP